MPISFPYPTIGTVNRPAGQGCLSCVHSEYCQALYWNTRYTDYTPSARSGTACSSWSNNPAQRITVITQDDINENDRLTGVVTNIDNGLQEMTNLGVVCEPNRNGIVDPVTGSDKENYYGIG